MQKNIQGMQIYAKNKRQINIYQKMWPASNIVGTSLLQIMNPLNPDRDQNDVSRAHAVGVPTVNILNISALGQ
jgi:hypothetical protein